MMGLSAATLLGGFFLIGLPGSALAQPASLPDSDQLYRRIRDRYRPMYENYLGVEDNSRVEARVYNSQTDQLKESSQLLTNKRNYFYRKAEHRILKYVKDGVELDPRQAERGGDEQPMVPIWDADGPRHYRVQVVRRDQYRGQPCYVLEVEAKKKTKRHFVGTVQVHAETLDLLMMEGGMAAIPFGVDAVRFTARFRQLGDVALYDTFEMEVLVDVPLLYPDVKFVWQSQVLESWPIPR